MQKMALYVFFIGSIFLYSSMGCRHVVREKALSYREDSLNLKEKDVLQPPLDNLKQEENLNNKAETEKTEKEVFISKLEYPNFVKGIYLSNKNSRNIKKLTAIFEKAKCCGINTFVLDVQPKMVPKENVDFLLKNQILPIARVVVFPGGLKKGRPEAKYLEKIYRTIEDAILQGFLEVQLDYIRYADEPALHKLPLKEKYREISLILAKAKEITSSHQVRLSADVFGRVTLNQNDTIGQKLELFAEYVDSICPMLYPSHYYNDKYRMGNPFETLREGVANTKNRIPKTKVVAYVQAFSMGLRYAKLPLTQYIIEQIRGVREGGGDGFIFWNAHNEYDAVFAALAAEAKSPVAQIY